MTPAEHEARIDDAWRHLVTCATVEGRAAHCRAFLAAVAERNAERTPAQLEEIERARGLR